MSQVPKSLHLYIQDDTWFPSQGAFKSPIPAATSMRLTLCEWNAACRKDHAPRTQEVEVGTSFYMIDIPCIIKKHPAWFQLSLISASWLTFFSHHQNELAEKCRQNPLYICRFSESMRGIWWQSPSIQKARWDLSQLILSYLFLIWKLTCNNTWK